MATKRRKGYGFSCMSCRERKISCDGVRPTCGHCRRASIECKVPPPVRSLRRIGRSVSPSGSIPPRENAGVWMDQMADRMARMENRIEELESRLRSRRPSPTALNHSKAPSPVVDDGEKDGPYRLCIDGSGNVLYQGPTAWSHGSLRGVDEPSSILGTSWPRPDPHANDMTDPALVPLLQALATAKHVDIAPELGNALIDCFFSYEVFSIIQRSLFLRDMALGGPMFSEFLLRAIYASATRMIDILDEGQAQTLGEMFLRSAKDHLVKEMEDIPKVPTIQGLLLLSGRECALGSVSNGWNHAGLAFRMIQDMGIHLAPQSVSGAAQLSAEELATRERLFWSAFVWDKAISLAMGREPTFAPRIGRHPSDIPDFDDDEEPWSAYYPLSSVDDWLCLPAQTSGRNLQVDREAILHEIISQLYSTESRLSRKAQSAFVSRCRRSLDELWNDVPEQMHFDPSRPFPPWIFMFHMLFHATLILLYRPTLARETLLEGQGDAALCLEHSKLANLMTLNYTRHFGVRVAYVAMYSSFVAASFDIVLLESPVECIYMEALERLRVWLGIMDKSVPRVPSIQQPVQALSSSTYAVVAKHPHLARTEAGDWILARRAPAPETSFMDFLDTLNNENNGGGGAFDFFDLLGPVQPMALDGTVA